jgi:hypothetical protein
MDIKAIEISKDEFDELRPSGSFLRLSRTYAHIYSILKKYPDQRNFYMVDSSEAMDSSIKELYARFGIIIGHTNVLDLEKRNYILILSPEAETIGIPEYCETFAQDYLPEGAVPQYYIIELEIDTFEEMNAWNERVTSVYPGISTMASYSDLVKENSRGQRFEEMIADVKALGLEAFVIDPHVDRISTAFKQDNKRTIDVFVSVESELARHCKENPKTILMYNGTHTSIAATLCAFMFYKYSVNSHLSPSATKLYLSYVSDLYSNPYLMLAEEHIEYLRKLPDVATSFDDGNNMEYFVYLEKAAMDCRVTIACVDADDISGSEVEKYDLSLQDLIIIPLYHEVDLTTTNITYFRDNHDTLLKMFSKFEDRYPTAKRLMDVTNTLFIEHNGKKKLAHIEDIQMKLPAVFMPVNSSLPKFSKELDTTAIRSIYPLNIFAGYKEVMGPYVAEVQKAYQQAMGQTGQRVSITMNFFKHNHALGLAIRSFNNWSSYILDVYRVPDFVTLGLWWDETYRYRVSITRTLGRYLDAKKSRKYTTFFSIFGGPFISFYPTLEIREEYLKERV